jgi:TMP repeat-containing protein
MKYGETFKWDNIKSGLQEGIKQGLGTVKKSATVVKTKTVDMTREGKRQIEALGKKSKESLKKVFKKVA